MFGGSQPPQGLSPQVMRGIPIGTSLYGKTIPVVWGTTRIAGNIIWMPNELWDQTPGALAGKGGGSGAQDAFYQGVAIAICEGQVTLGRVWRDKEVFGDLSKVETSNPFTFYNGARPQTPWTGYSGVVPVQTKQILITVPATGPFVVTPALVGTNPLILDVQYFDPVKNVAGALMWLNLTLGTGLSARDISVDTGQTGTAGGTPSNPILTFDSSQAGLQFLLTYRSTISLLGYSLGYGGTSYVITSRLALGSSNTLKNFSFEVNGRVGSGDQNPADVVADFLTDAAIGCGWPSSQLEVVSGQDGTAASGWKRYCDQAALLISPAMDEERTALEWLRWLMDAGNAECVFTGDLLRIVPLGDTAVGTFAPYVTPVYSIGDDNLLGGAADEGPVTVTRTRDSETYNCFPVEYLDSLVADVASKYNPAVVEDVEQADVERSGTLRRASVSSLHCITKGTVAQYISRVKAQRSVWIRNTFTFKVGHQYARIEPLDFVQLTDSLSGITNQVLRVVSIEENVDDDSFTVVAEEWPFGVTAPPLFTPQTGSGGGGDVSAAPPFANPPTIFVPPRTITVANSPELWIAGAGGSKDWGGAQVWLSWDNATYEYQGDIGSATSGVISQDLAAGPPIDDTNTLRADVRTSSGTLASVTATERDNLKTLCWVDGELLAYQTATLVSTGVYDLTHLRRGLKGTLATQHTARSSAQFILLNDKVMRIPITLERYGSTAYVKLVSFNTAKTLVADISQVNPFTLQLPPRKDGSQVLYAAPYKVNFDTFDLSEWDVIAASTAGLVSLPTGADAGLGVSGGATSSKYLRVGAPGSTGVLLVSKALVPVDPRKLYALSVKLSQVRGGGSSGPTAGLVAVGLDGQTFQQKNGTTTSSLSAADIHKAPVTVPLTVGDWQLFTGYWKGTSATGTDGNAASSTPGQLVTSTKFVRLAIKLDIDTLNTAAACGELQLYEVAAETPLDGSSIVPFTVDASSKVVAGSVDTNRLRANAVEASRLTVGVSQNQLFGSDFASGVPTVFYDLGGGYVGGWEIKRSTSATGTSALAASANTLGGSTDPQNERSLNVYQFHQSGRVGTTTDYVQLITDYMPVVAGAKYCASVYTGTINASLVCGISWYDSGRGYLSDASINAAATNNQEASGGQVLSGYKRIYNVATAPVNAAYAIVYFRKFDTVAGQTSSDMFLTRAMWEELPTSVDPNDGLTKGPLLPSKWQPSATTVLEQNAVRSDALQTSNYAEDGFGNATAGARMQSRGAALQVAPGNLKVGKTYMDAAYFTKMFMSRGIIQLTGGSLSGSMSNATLTFRGSDNSGNGVIRISFTTLPPGITAITDALTIAETYSNRTLQTFAVGSTYVDVACVDSTGASLNLNTISLSLKCFVVTDVGTGGVAL